MIAWRRFLVVMALAFWQGGFAFYAAVVVPIGSDELGAFPQASVTRRVARVLNMAGLGALAILLWDQEATRNQRRGRRIVWLGLAGSLAALFALHGLVDHQIEWPAGRVVDYPRFYFWHRLYLWVATAQWLLGMAFTALTLRAWAMFMPGPSAPPPASSPVLPSPPPTHPACNTRD